MIKIDVKVKGGKHLRTLVSTYKRDGVAFSKMELSRQSK
jgi:hypothetical protein